MEHLSIVLPAYREPHLNKTIKSILDNATGEIEIIPVIDGYLPEEPFIDDPRVKPILLGENKGMRGAMNAGFEQATGKYLMKLDSHCIVDKGFDEILIEDCKDNWLLVPRRYSLDEKTWTRSETRPIFDYHYLSFPGTNDLTYGYSLQVVAWQRKVSLPEIDDIMTFQGSCWFANRDYFMKHVGYLDDRLETYGTFAQDQQEIGLKYWLGGGEVKVDKRTWYAHLSKRGHHYASGAFSRKHKKDQAMFNGNEWGTKHWMNNEEPNMKPFEWWVSKFSPIPTWPDNWKEVWGSK
ncbi:MAG: glycosyltransferase family 2 protein [Candidatus Izemoplasmatales bacterium]